MGGFSSQVQAPQTGQSGGKVGNVASQVADQPQNVVPQGGYQPQPVGKGGRQTNSATSGQPTMGAPNQYSNTVGQWDNTQIQPVSHGKGKGG